MSTGFITKMKHSTNVFTWEIQDMDLVFNMGSSRMSGFIDSKEFEVAENTRLHSIWNFRLRASRTRETNTPSKLVLGVQLLGMKHSPHLNPGLDYDHGYDPFEGVYCKYDVTLAGGRTAKPFATVSRAIYNHRLDFEEIEMDRKGPNFLYTDLMPVRDFLEHRTEYLPENRIVITIEFKLAMEPIHYNIYRPKSVRHIHAKAVDSVLQVYAGLLDDPEFSDFSIECQGVKFQVHKMILSARSSWFKTCLSDRWREVAEDPNVLKLDDIEPEVMTTVLRFIYSAQLHNIPEASDKFSLLRVLDAAEKFDLDPLKTACFSKLFISLNDQNAAELAMTAYNYRANEETTTIIQSYCLRRHAQLMENPEYKQYYLTTPKAFIKV